MLKKFAMIFGLTALAATACNYEIHDDDGDYDDWRWDDSGSGSSKGGSEGDLSSEDAQETCDAYCVGLVECGRVDGAAFLDCRDSCVERFEDDSDAVASGCTCVLEAQCEVDVARSCEEDPLPGVWFGQPGDDGDPGAGGASSDEPGEPAGEACVASCQCDAGEACVEGFCSEPEAPAMVCDTDCDCTSGESCDGGFCQ